MESITGNIIWKIRRISLLTWHGFLSLVIVLLLLSGCATSSVVSGPPRKPITALVVTFNDAADAPGSGRIFTPAFISALRTFSVKNKTPYIILSNVALHRTLEQLQLELEDWQHPANRLDIARQAGADAIISGTVTIWRKGNWGEFATVGFTAECVSTENGQILWSIYKTHNPSRWASEERTPEDGAKETALKGIMRIREQL